jgi:hypothetical protein
MEGQTVVVASLPQINKIGYRYRCLVAVELQINGSLVGFDNSANGQWRFLVMMIGAWIIGLLF